MCSIVPHKALGPAVLFWKDHTVGAGTGLHSAVHYNKLHYKGTWTQYVSLTQTT